MKTSKEAVKNSVSWHCIECDKDFEHKEFIAHIKGFHEISDTSGTRQMLSHMDGAKWFSSTYEFTIGGKKFIQSVVCLRQKDDFMYSDDGV